LVVSIEDAIIARLRAGKQKFEILVDPKKALEFKRGLKINLEEALAYPAVYRDARRMDTASMQDLQKVFGCTDVVKIAEKIIKNGELLLTTEQRRQLAEEKRKQIATIISKKAINPQTNTPHPPNRILSAMDQCGVNIDPFLDAEQQIDKVIEKIRLVLPLKFQKITFEFIIPAQFAGKAFSILKNFGTVKEKWLENGDLQATVEILGGLQDDLFQKISSLTHGNFQSKIVKKEDL